jgi:hypothetical protein
MQVLEVIGQFSYFESECEKGIISGCSKVKLFRTPPCHMPDRIGPLSYAHWVWLHVTDLARKYDIVAGEGFPHRGFLSHHLYKGCYH